MTIIRRFGPETRQPVPRPGTVNFYARMIQIPAKQRDQLGDVATAQRFGGMPIALEQDVTVVALMLDPHGSIDEHDAPHPILFMVIEGSGFVRVGGPDAEAVRVTAGDAVLWPPNTLHVVWTEDEALRAIVVEYPPRS